MALSLLMLAVGLDKPPQMHCRLLRGRFFKLLFIAIGYIAKATEEKMRFYTELTTKFSIGL